MASKSFREYDLRNLEEMKYSGQSTGPTTALASGTVVQWSLYWGA